jgi:CheY-like chemotaxis protein
MHIPHIFIAEDSEYNRILFSKMLDQLGYSSTTAMDGKQLIDLLVSSVPSLLLLDIEMPGMDSLEFMRSIRQGETGADRELPVIALTGNYKESLPAKYKEAGFSGWISKPFTRQTLKDKIEPFINSMNNNSSLETKRTAPDSEETLYSLKYLREGSDGDEEFLKTMIGMFVESTPAAIQAMRDGLLRSDWDIIRQESHKLRSHLRYFGMIKAAVLTEEIERTATNNPTEQILGELLEKVDLICQTCIRQLSEEFHL